jgi:hypothetical protein
MSRWAEGLCVKPKSHEKVFADVAASRDAAAPGVQLFVGDLPPHWGPREVEALFGHIAPVLGARVMGPNCYGFVTFPSEEDAAYVLQARVHAAPDQAPPPACLAPG